MVYGSARSAIFRQVFSNLNTKTSSDLIVALHDIGKHSDIEMMIKINPVYCLEFLNWETNSSSNLRYVVDQFNNLSVFSQKEVKLSYNYIYRLFLDDPDLNEIFPLNWSEETPDDDVAFKMFTELSYKRDYCSYN